jgi:hypothetical protein
MDIIFGKHDGCNQEYCWTVPKQFINDVSKGCIMLVDTIHGKQIARATTDVISGKGAEDIALRQGAYHPIKSVIGVVTAEMREYIVRDYLRDCLINLDSYKVPF